MTQTGQIAKALGGALGITGAALSFAGSIGTPLLLTTAWAPLVWANLASAGTTSAGAFGFLKVSNNQSYGLLTADWVQSAPILAQLITGSVVCPQCAALVLGGTALNTISTVLGAMTNDPPDPNYKTVATSQLTTVTANQFAALGEYAPITADLLNSANKLRAAAYILLAETQKAEGAQAAGDQAWAELHATNVENALPVFLAALKDFDQSLHSYVSFLNGHSDLNLMIDLSAFEQFKQLALNHSLPKDVLAELQSLGLLGIFSLQEIETSIADLDFGGTFTDALDAYNVLLITTDSLVNGIVTDYGDANIPEPSTLLLLIAALVVAPISIRRVRNLGRDSRNSFLGGDADLEAIQGSDIDFCELNLVKNP